MPLLVVACLSLIGGLAWWFMRTELPPGETVIPVESAPPGGGREIQA